MSLYGPFSKPSELQHPQLPPWDQHLLCSSHNPPQTTPWYRGQPAEGRYGQLTRDNLILPNLKSEPCLGEKTQHIKNLFLMKLLENTSSAILLQGFSIRCQYQEGMGWTPSNPTRTPAIPPAPPLQQHLTAFREAAQCPMPMLCNSHHGHTPRGGPSPLHHTRQAAGAWPSAACQLSPCSTCHRAL